MRFLKYANLALPNKATRARKDVTLKLIRPGTICEGMNTDSVEAIHNRKLVGNQE